MSVCSVPDCSRPINAKGFCKGHYWRFWRHGDPLGGGAPRTTPRGAPLRFIDEIAIKHESGECLHWPLGKTSAGYGEATIDGKSVLAHRYVCQSVHGDPPTPSHEAAHSCGNGHLGCVNPRHLSWKTPAENQADRVVHGTHNRGERNYNAKLTESQAREIRAVKGVESKVATANRFKISLKTVSHIQAGRRWAYLEENHV